MKAKHVWLRVLIFILVLTLVPGVLPACTGAVTETKAESAAGTEAEMSAAAAETGTTAAEAAAETAAPAKELVQGIPFTGLDEERAVRDYEAFWEILEESYPMLDMLRRKGADPEALKAAYRSLLPVGASGEEYRSFYDGLITELCGPEVIGHLSALYQGFNLLDSDFQYYAYALEKWPDDPWVEMMGTLFADPHVIGFYDLRVKPRESDEEPPRIKMEGNVEFGYHPQSDYAYLHIDSFLNEDPEDSETIRGFFEECEREKIGHIIVDVRGNLGGYNDYWMRNIVAPNIKEVLEIQNIGLYNETPQNAPFLHYYASSTYEEDLAEMKKEGELPDVMIRWNLRERELPELPELVEDDVKQLKKAFQETLRVAPTEETPLFSGKFWILVDEKSYSASEYLVSFAKRTGFATVVGRESGGDGSCVVTIYNQLPESGLVLRYNVLYGLNSDGSCSEDRATRPDYETAEGQDALDLTVALIAEMNAP